MKKHFVILMSLMAAGLTVAAEDTNIANTIAVQINLTTNQEAGLKFEYRQQQDAYQAATNNNPSAMTNLVAPSATFPAWYKAWVEKSEKAQADYCYAKKIAAQEQKADLREAIKATADLGTNDIAKVRAIVEAYSRGTAQKQTAIYNAATQ